MTDLKEAVGTNDAATERHLSYNNNGTLATLLDAENNLTTYKYDGYDRLSEIDYPSTAKGSGTSNAADNEQFLNYDANGNVGQQKLRDGSVINFTYDHRDRLTLKDLPGTEYDVSYRYDNLNRLTSNFTKDANGVTVQNLTFGWDALSREISEAGPHGTTSFGYDGAGRRTSVTYSANGGGSALTVNYAYLATGDLSSITQSASTLAAYAYDGLGNRTSVTYGNGASQAFTYDAVSRLASLTNDLSGTANDLTISSIAYNPANEITSLTRSNDAYALTPLASASTSYSANGLNQQISIGGSTVTWDTKGNLTSDPSTAKTYGYSSENLLTSASGGVTLTYDPMMRLYQVAGASTTRFGYDGPDVIAEYNGSSQLQRRFVYDDQGQPILWYEGTGTSTPRYLSQDQRGSVISVTDGSGAVLALNKYDEYGNTQSSNPTYQGRFGYTGQKWIGEAGLYDYKARDYLPQHGIFAQTDPVGQEDSPNLYAYVGDDPVNLVDPLGLTGTAPPPPPPNIVITGIRRSRRSVCDTDPSCGNGGAPRPGGATAGAPGGGAGGRGAIVVIGHRTPKSAVCSSHPILGVLGKINGAINTAIGIGAASGSAAIGRLLGYHPNVRLGNNSVQVTNAWTIRNRAYTIGNVQVYAAGHGPERVQSSYTGAIVNVGAHEEGHTIQSQILGPLYLPVEAVGSLFGNKNVLEVGADRYASGQSCTGF